MKKLIPWLLAALMVAVVACDDDSSSSGGGETYATRAFDVEIGAGNTNWTWTQSGTRYHVPQTLTVPAGQTLTIGAGVDVYFGPTAGLIVEGTLNAVGTLGNPVRFLGSANAEDFGLWQIIVFRAGSDASRMEYCVVAFGSKFNNTEPEKVAAIVITDSSPTIQHCLVWMNQYNGISLQRDSRPTLRSNIIYENDGSGIAIDTSHVGGKLDAPVVIDWLGEGLLANNNVSANSSLPIRFTPDFAQVQWDTTAAGVQLQFGNDVLYTDENGDDVHRRNENNDKVDVYGNSIEDAMFDELSADFQSFNSCSPCIEAAFDYDGDQRADVGPILYVEAPGELRKRLKTTALGASVYTVTCDAFSVEDVTMAGATVRFNGYFGLTLSGAVAATGTEFTATADRQQASSWKSVVLDDNAGGTARFEDCRFSYGAESSYSGQDYITAGGMLELRGGAVAEVVGCTFEHAGSHGVSVDGPGSLAHVADSEFDDIGLSAFYVTRGGRGKIDGSRVTGCGSYGVYFYDTGYFGQIEGNLIAGGGLYGIKLQAAPAVQILQNTIVGNGYGGIKVENNSDPLVRYNLIVDNDYAGSEVATGIVGNQLGATLDTNNPDINVNWISGNGGDELAAMPQNWTIGACNAFDAVTLPGDYGFSQTIADCEQGGAPHAIGWNHGAAGNPGPMLASLADPTVHEDQVLEIWLGAVSFGGDPDFVYVAAIDDENVALELEGNRLRLTPAANWFGSASLTVTATNSEGSDSETTTLTVLPLNDAPIIEAVEARTIAMDEVLELQLDAWDIEDDEFNLTAEAIVDESFNPDNSETPEVAVSASQLLTLTPGEGWTGRLIVVVTAEETMLEGALATRISFTVTVN